jgi:hypothetical protein
MARVALVTLPDEGAADMVRGALNEVGIQPEFERVFLEHPYGSSILAEPWRVFVPADRLADAQAAVARLIHDMAAEVDTQAMAWSWRGEGQGQQGQRHEDGHDRHEAQPRAARTWRPSRVTVGWALALTILIPFLTIGLYLRVARPITLRTTPGIQARDPSPPSSLFVD